MLNVAVSIRGDAMADTARPNALLVIDLEATCWRKPDGRRSEIIEIGAIATNAEGVSLGEFQSFVRPILNPVLSDFCRELTHIKQADVDKAPRFPEVLASLLEWTSQFGSLTFASWGAYDRKQLLSDCELHGVAYPFGDEHVNIKKTFAQMVGRRPMGMAAALRSLGLDLVGTHHRALDDARNIAPILAVLLASGASVSESCRRVQAQRGQVNPPRPFKRATDGNSD